jgi:hypothetical protein
MSGQIDPAGRPQPPPAGGEANAATIVAIGFVVAGWALYVFLGPVAVFLTWYGDCFDEPCPVPGTIDQLAYAFDVLWVLAFPALAYFAYRGRTWAWAALLAIAVVLDLQLVAAVAGARGFEGFGFTLPAAGLLTFGAAFGLVMSLPRFRDRPETATVGELAGIGCLGVIVAIIALQGFLAGIGGPLVVIGAIMAIALFVIAVAAYANRDRRPGGARPVARGQDTIRRRRP